jgi:hypothetical protein
MACILQPSADFFGLKRPISRAEIAVQQLRNFFSGTRFSDHVQPSNQMLVESGFLGLQLAAFDCFRCGAVAMRSSLFVVAITKASQQVLADRS